MVATSDKVTAYSFSDLEKLWKDAGGNATYAPMAAAVAMAESGGHPNATNRNSNGSTDRGLWQINSVHGAMSTLDVKANARAAVSLSKNGTSWKAWCTAWSSGKCSGTYLGTGAPFLNFLPKGSSTGTVPSGTASADTSTPALKAIAFEYSQIGLPYKFGAEQTGKDFDCSGLTQTAYAKAGITIPRTAAEQQKFTQRISKAELRPGDLIFWGNPAHHVAMYIGGGRIIQAPQTGEKIDNVKVWGTPSNYGRVPGSKAQDNNGDLVSQSGADSTTNASGSGTDLPAFNPLNPSDWLSEIYDNILLPIAWALEMALGIIVIGLGGYMVVKSRSEEAAKPVASGSAAAGRFIAKAAGPPVARNRPMPKAKKRPTKVTPKADRSTSSSGGRSVGTNPSVIEGEVV